MAKLFDTYDRIVPTWLAAAQHLDHEPERKAKNLLLEIKHPLVLSPEDHAVMRRVDAALEGRGLPLSTVAGTIFPLDMYKRYGRPGYYDEYKKMLVRGKKPNSWGTYAMRMIDRAGAKAGKRINPLEMLVQRMSDEGQQQRTDTAEVSFGSAYELGIADPAFDMCSPRDFGGEVPTYDASLDGKKWMNMPCLSHVTFKRVEVTGGHAVDLTAIYRSHYYCTRGLGNLIGLAQLQSFVAKESGLAVGTLSCLSSHAVLDVGKWGGVAAAKRVMGI